MSSPRLSEKFQLSMKCILTGQEFLVANWCVIMLAYWIAFCTVMPPVWTSSKTLKVGSWYNVFGLFHFAVPCLAAMAKAIDNIDRVKRWMIEYWTKIPQEIRRLGEFILRGMTSNVYTDKVLPNPLKYFPAAHLLQMVTSAKSIWVMVHGSPERVVNICGSRSKDICCFLWIGERNFIAFFNYSF